MSDPLIPPEDSTFVILAGQGDLETDNLYFAIGQDLVKLSPTNRLIYKWRTKKITIPQKTTLSAMQVEAEQGWGLVARIYADDELLHEQHITQKKPFRLPATQRRAWEIELEGSAEVFNVALGQSFDELSSV